MANLIIKPTSGGSLILQDEGGDAALTVGTTGVSTIANATITAGTFPNGHILQVVQTVKTATFSTSGTGWTDVTGLSVTITPSDASNKILVIMNCNSATQSGQRGGLKLVRGSQDICIGDAGGSRIRATAGITAAADSGWNSCSATFLDSPSTTSATTYKVQTRNETSGVTYLNRTHSDSDAASYYRGTSQITVMEVVA